MIYYTEIIMAVRDKNKLQVKKTLYFLEQEPCYFCEKNKNN